MIKLNNQKIEGKKKEQDARRNVWQEWKGRKGIRRLFGIFIFLVIIVFVFWKMKYTHTSSVAEKGEKFLTGQEGEVTTVTESVLEETIKKGNLYTAEYPYNGYTAVYEEEQKTVKYYVAYEGTVKAGIDVRKIKVSLDKDAGTIIIRLPEATVADPQVDPGTMEYIFEDKKYNTETVAQEAYRAACEDLAERVQEDVNIRVNAEESAKAAEKALVEPWVNQMDGRNYTIKVLAYGEQEEDE